MLDGVNCVFSDFRPTSTFLKLGIKARKAKELEIHEFSSFCFLYPWVHYPSIIYWSSIYPFIFKHHQQSHHINIGLSISIYFLFHHPSTHSFAHLFTLPFDPSIFNHHHHTKPATSAYQYPSIYFFSPLSIMFINLPILPPALHHPSIHLARTLKPLCCFYLIHPLNWKKKTNLMKILVKAD